MPAKKPLTLARDLRGRVRQMMPIARTLVWGHGIDDGRAEFDEMIPLEEPQVEDDADQDAPDSHINTLITWTSGVYALGIAVGLLLRDDPSFTKGGAR